MTRMRSRLGLSSLFALALGSCGADVAPAPEAAPQSVAARGAELGAEADNPVVDLQCGKFYIEITRATGSAADQGDAEDRCAADLRETRPVVHCDDCRYAGQCKKLTRRSDIIQNCERKDGRWQCSCAQRSVLGCHPCVKPDPGAVPGTGAGSESCGSAEFSPPEADAPTAL